MSTRISAFFFLSCLILFSIGAFFSLPPKAEGWKLEPPTLWGSIRGETSAAVEKELEDKLAYKNETTDLWGSIRYGLFNTGSKGVVIGEEGWLFTKEEFEDNPNFDANIKASYQRITDAIATLNTHGITTIMAWVPSKSRLHADKLGEKSQPQKHLSITPPQDIPLINGADVFANLRTPAFMPTDTHWSQAGSLAMAQAIADYVHSHYPSLELTAKAFTTKEKAPGGLKVVTYDGDLEEFVPMLRAVKFFSDIHGGRVKNYVTEAPTSETNSLFGDEALDVTLIGTSYSAQKEWHFEGFLKQALQADVLNLADEGQGPFAPMDGFLERLKKGEITTKLVIWEFPERYLPRDYKKEEGKS